MIKNRPAFFLFNNLWKAFRRVVHGDFKHLVLNRSIGIQILSRIIRKIHHYTAYFFLYDFPVIFHTAPHLLP